MNTVRIRNSILLFITAAIWGCAFVAQSVSMDYIGPYTMTGVRSLIGGIVLLPLVFARDYKKKQNSNLTEQVRRQENKMSVIGGICCGLVFTVATMTQQVGICTTTVGKAGFITALYIVMVPIIGIFLGKKVGIKLGVSIVLSVVGLYLLCMAGNLDMSGNILSNLLASLALTKGDTLVLICAFVFSIHILVIDYFSPKADGVKISCIQFFVAGVICSIGMFVFEKPVLSDILAAYIPILYAGVMSCGVAYTLQIIGQKNLPPTLASLIMSLESVFSALAGWLILGEKLTALELGGCVLMFIAIILAQLPEKVVLAKVDLN